MRWQWTTAQRFHHPRLGRSQYGNNAESREVVYDKISAARLTKRWNELIFWGGRDGNEKRNRLSRVYNLLFQLHETERHRREPREPPCMPGTCAMEFAANPAAAR